MSNVDDEVVCCPGCGSTQFHTGQRGWSWSTGFFGSGKVVMTCLKCGRRFAPPVRTSVFTWVVLAFIVLLIIKGCS
jgi:hypothetical protein